MRLEKQEAAGGPVVEQESRVKQFASKSTSLPFGQSIEYSAIAGPTYLTAQTLIQQVAYSLSDKLYSYSPETFDLDLSVKEWAASKTPNAYGYTTSVSSMQTRAGAGSIALGYMFSKDFDLTRRHIPQSLVASSSSLHHLRSSLDQLSLLYAVANPFVAHIAAVDYASGPSSGLVTDYASALTLAEELGLGLVSSASAYEVQHMALFSTLLSTIIPTVHIYDGITVGRETIRVIDVLDQAGLKNIYASVLKEISSVRKRTPTEDKAAQLMKAFNNELGTDYKLFEYHGHTSPETVLVVFGTVEASLASQVAEKLSTAGEKVGVVNVRVYRPFFEELFIATLPKSVRHVAVLGQVVDQQSVTDKSIHSNLYSDVLAAVAFSDKWASVPSVVDRKYARDELFTPTSVAAVFRELSAKLNDSDERIQLLNQGQAEQYTFWDLDESKATSTPSAVGKLLATESSSNVFLKQYFDNLIQGGVTRTDIRISKKSIETSYAIEEADVTVIGDENLLKKIDILKNVKVGGKIVIKIRGIKDKDLEKKISATVRQDIVVKKIELFLLDPTLSTAVEKDAAAESILLELAFLLVARPDLLNATDKLAIINGSKSLLEEISADLEKALRHFEVPESWAETEDENNQPSLPSTVNTSGFAGFSKEEIETNGVLRDWQAAAKGLAFKEAYATQSVLRPDLSVKTYTIHVQENRRLTPLKYDRNIFHIEFDLGTSGLKYDIGEALGIHAENDARDVQEFMEFYGLNPEEVVEVPSREDPAVLEILTVFQSLVQNIDIFGKPPKRFYESLAEFATDEKEKNALFTLGGPDGTDDFKHRAEFDTITFADILQEFTSAHPSFHDLVRIVTPMKRREYSIASSQQVSPTTIALMIVVVQWVDTKGRDRYGQATRYLNQLRPGAAVTVSVKPSVMKLPVKDTAPLIMAGLGTGLAPFRAFVQYRAMQKSEGKNIGAILLYMGSRHQREEYLYGEEWEAYQDAGVITLLGRAFSRDQPQKIYIQDRMRQTMGEIIESYIKDEGSFYLCGPTWPVPDVTEVLIEACEREGKLRGKKIDGRKEIERLKDEGRYVLEVY